MISPTLNPLISKMSAKIHKAFQMLQKSQLLPLIISMASFLGGCFCHIYSMDKDIAVLKVQVHQLSESAKETNDHLNNIDNDIDKLNSFIAQYFATQGNNEV